MRTYKYGPKASIGFYNQFKSGLIVPSGGLFKNVLNQNPLHPNEPAGFERIAETNFSQTMQYGVTVAGITGDAGSGDFHISSTARPGIVNDTDPTAPFSPSAIMKYNWPNALRDGNNGIGYFLLWKSGNISGTGAQYTQIYISYIVRYNGTSSDPAVRGLDFQNQGTGSKLFYIPYANTARENHSYIMLDGDDKDAETAPNGTIASSFKLRWWISQMNPDGSDPGHSSGHDANVNGSKLFTIGDWHNLEVWMKINDIGLANGAGKIWIDGIQTHDLTGLTFRSSTNPDSFYRFHHDGVWGGDIGQIRNRIDYTFLDHVYVSGIVQ